MLRWLEEWAEQAHLPSLRFDAQGAGTLEQAIYNSTRYKELEGMPAFVDFLGDLRASRKGLIQQLTVPGGSLDKWGRSHDDEKRAVLAFVDAIISRLAIVHKHADQLRELRRVADLQRDRYAPGGQIHAD